MIEQPSSPVGADRLIGEEISRLADEIASKLPSRLDPKKVEASLEAVGIRAGEAAFISVRLGLPSQSPLPAVQLALHAAFLCLLLDSNSALARMVREIAAVAHRRTAGALLPYVERDDLQSLFRWKLFTLPDRFFVRERLLQQPNLRRFLSTVARNLAIDEVRKLVGHPTEDLDPAELDPSAAPSEERFVLFDSIRSAFDRATQGQPAWLAEAALALFLETRDREETLNEINRRREEQGLPNWSPNALAAFLKRLRASMRRELARE